MDKRQSPALAASAPGGITGNSKVELVTKFAGTENPRCLRVLQALSLRARSRKQIDEIAGASNGPQVIANLRQCGLRIPCFLVNGIDRDGRPIRFGVYYLSASDRMKIVWQRKRERMSREAAGEK